MAVRDPFRTESANQVLRYAWLPGLTGPASGGSFVVRISLEEPRKRAGRLLAEHFVDVVRHDQRVKGLWLHQGGGETLVTVVAERVDQELEFRLHDMFEALAADQEDPSVGELFIYDQAQGIPGGAPKGEELLSAHASGSPQPS